MRFCNHYRYFFLTLFLLYRSPVGVCKSGGVLNYRDLRTVGLHANESTNILFSTMLRTEYTATMQRVCTTIQAKWKSRRSSRNSGNEFSFLPYLLVKQIHWMSPVVSRGERLTIINIDFWRYTLARTSTQSSTAAIHFAPGWISISMGWDLFH